MLNNLRLDSLPCNGSFVIVEDTSGGNRSTGNSMDAEDNGENSPISPQSDHPSEFSCTWDPSQNTNESFPMSGATHYEEYPMETKELKIVNGTATCEEDSMDVAEQLRPIFDTLSDSFVTLGALPGSSHASVECCSCLKHIHINLSYFCKNEREYYCQDGCYEEYHSKGKAMKHEKVDGASLNDAEATSIRIAREFLNGNGDMKDSLSLVVSPDLRVTNPGDIAEMMRTRAANDNHVSLSSGFVVREQRILKEHLHLKMSFEECLGHLKQFWRTELGRVTCQDVHVATLRRSQKTDVPSVLQDLMNADYPIPVGVPAFDTNGFMLPEMDSFLPTVIRNIDMSHPIALNLGIGDVHGKTALLRALFDCHFEAHKHSMGINHARMVEFQVCTAQNMRQFHFADVHGDALLNPVAWAVAKHATAAFVHVNACDVTSAGLIHVSGEDINIANLFHHTHDIPNIAIFIHGSTEECCKAQQALSFHIEPKVTMKFLAAPDDESNWNVETKYNFEREIYTPLLRPILEELDTSLLRPHLCVHEGKQFDNLYDDVCTALDYEYQAASFDMEKLKGALFPLSALQLQIERMRWEMDSQLSQTVLTDTQSDEIKRIFAAKELSLKEQRCTFVAPHTLVRMYVEVVLACPSSFEQYTEIMKQAIDDWVAPKFKACAERVSQYKEERRELRAQLLRNAPDKEPWSQELENLDQLLRNEENVLSKQRLSLAQVQREVKERSSGSRTADNIPFDDGQDCVHAVILVAKHAFNCGNGLEIINGDTMIMDDTSLQQYVDDIQSQFCVVTILGAQSSGKSTLLNELFGLNFQTSSTACTKGMNMAKVYVQLETDSRKKELIILDSEGLLSIQRDRDPTFDKKIMLFAFALSNSVLINLRGEAHKDMASLLQMATFCFSELEMKSFKPSLFLALRWIDNTHENRENQDAAMESLFKATAVDARLLTDYVHYRSDTMFLMPTAFKQTKLGLWRGEQEKFPMYRREYNRDWIQEAVALRKSVIHASLQNAKYNQDCPSIEYKFPSSLANWIKEASSTWRHWIQKNEAFIDYESLTAMRVHQALSGTIRNTEEVIRCGVVENVLMKTLNHLIYSLSDNYVGEASADSCVQAVQDIVQNDLYRRQFADLLAISCQSAFDNGVNVENVKVVFITILDEFLGTSMDASSSLAAQWTEQVFEANLKQMREKCNFNIPKDKAEKARRVCIENLVRRRNFYITQVNQRVATVKSKQDVTDSVEKLKLKLNELLEKKEFNRVEAEATLQKQLENIEINWAKEHPAISKNKIFDLALGALKAVSSEHTLVNPHNWKDILLGEYSLILHELCDKILSSEPIRLGDELQHGMGKTAAGLRTLIMMKLPEKYRIDATKPREIMFLDELATKLQPFGCGYRLVNDSTDDAEFQRQLCDSVKQCLETLISLGKDVKTKAARDTSVKTMFKSVLPKTMFKSSPISQPIFEFGVQLGIYVICRRFQNIAEHIHQKEYKDFSSVIERERKRALGYFQGASSLPGLMEFVATQSINEVLKSIEDRKVEEFEQGFRTENKGAKKQELINNFYDNIFHKIHKDDTFPEGIERIYWAKRYMKDPVRTLKAEYFQSKFPEVYEAKLKAIEDEAKLQLAKIHTEVERYVDELRRVANECFPAALKGQDALALALRKLCGRPVSGGMSSQPLLANLRTVVGFELNPDFLIDGIVKRTFENEKGEESSNAQAPVGSVITAFATALSDFVLPKLKYEGFNFSSREDLFEDFFAISFGDCQHCCPYCNVLCFKTQCDGKHQSDRHFPMAFAGWRNMATKIPSTFTCDSVEASTRKYRGPDEKSHKFEDHQTKFHSEWHRIPQHANSATLDDRTTLGLARTWAAVYKDVCRREEMEESCPEEWLKLPKPVHLPN